MSINTSTRWQKFLQSLKKREVKAITPLAKKFTHQPEALEGRIAPANVLIVWDVLNTGTAALKSSLEAAGHTVTYSATDEISYNGTNPSPAAFGAVIHLNGTTYNAPMTSAGQSALQSYVNTGGLYIGGEWNGYERASLGNMTELLLLDRTGGTEGANTYNDVPAQAGHPLLANVPSSFSFTAGRSASSAHTFAVNPVTVLMTDQGGTAAVAVRDYGTGHVVNFNHSGNYGAYTGLNDTNVQRLYIDAVNYYAGGGVPPSGETDVALSGGTLTITDANGGNSNDTITFSRVGGNIRISDANNTLTAGTGATQDGANAVLIPLASITTGLVFNGSGGDDTFTVDFSGGNPFAIGGITFNGGAAGNDSLVITGGTTGTVTHSFTNANDGSVTLAGALAGTITYTGLEPITDNLSATDRVFTFTGGTESISLVDAAGANMTIDSTLAESVTFANPTGSITINAGSGDDTITITSMDAGFTGALSIFGDAANDSLTLTSLSSLSALTTNTETLATLPALTIGAGGLNLTASAGTITTGGAISSVGAISFTANDVVFGGGASSLSSGSTLLLRPNSDASSIGIGASATGTFNLDTTDLAALANGFTGITIGRSGTGTGSVDIRTSSFADDISVHGGTITVTGLNAGTNNVSLTSTVGPIQNGGDVATDITGGVVTLLKQGATRSADFYGIGGNGGNATITVDATTVSATAQNGTIALTSAGVGGVSMSLAQTNVFGPGNMFVGGATEDVTITSATAPGATFLVATITGFNLNASGISVGSSGVFLSTVTSGNITLGSATSSGGPINATAVGDITVNGLLSSGTSTALNGVNITGAGNIAATGGTSLTNTGTGALSGVISGGALTKLGAGTVTLTNANTYTGITTITGGTLQVGNGGTTGTLGAAAVTNNSALVFNRSNSLTIANNISGTGTLNVTAGGITASGVWSLGGDATLTSTAGITFNNTVTMAVNKNLTATATGTSDGTISLANSSADLAASGTGTISLTTARNISLSSGASVTTVNGALTLSANQQVTPTSGNFFGVSLDGAVQATGTGVVSVSGKGGTDASGYQYGVRISNTGSISGGSGAGDKTIVTGQGGISTGGGNAGVLLVDSAASALITSSGGNVVVTGSGGGSGGSGDNNGVSLGYFGGTITAGGTGNVTVLGTGGTASSFGNGLFVFDNAVITSGGGNVTATGVGSAGTAAGQFGIYNTGKIMAGGSGSVVVSGTALSTGSNSAGILVRSIANVSSANGTVQVTGAAASGNFGIDFESGGQIFSGGNQAVTLITDSMRVVGTASISSGTGATTIVQRTAGTSINLGAADVLTGSPLTLGLTDAEFDRITGGTLQIGNASSGAITVSAAISHTNTNAITLTAGTGLNINLNANFTTAGGPLTFSNAVVLAANAAIDTTNAGGTAAGAAVTFSGAIDADAAASNRTLSIAAGTGGAVSFGGAIGGAQAMQSLTVSSAASTSLGAVTTRSGGLAVTASAITLTGNIATDNGGTAGAVSFTGPVTLGANVAFDTDGSTDAGVSFSTTVNSDATPRTLQFTSGGGNVTFSGAVGGTNALQGLTIVSSNDANLGNVTTRNGGIAVTSSNNINLSGVLDTRTGGTAGAISLTGATRLTGNVSLNTNATTADAGITITGAVNADAVGNNRTLTLEAGTGSISATGNVGATTNIGTYTITSAASASIGRIDTRSGGVSVTATAITLGGNISTDGLGAAGSATFTGAVTLGAGVTIDTDSTASDGAISFSSTINGAQSLVLTGGAGNVTLTGAVGGTTPLTGVTVTAGDFNATSIAVAASSALSVTNTGTASAITGAVTGTSATLTKAGTGTLNLAGTNTYTGATTVSAGTLRVNGSVTSNVTVTSPGTLGGSGTITGNVSGNGTVAPGNSPGILTISGNFTPTGSVAFEVNSPYNTAGTDYDQIVVGGTVDLSGATLSITGGAAAASALQMVTLINKTSGGATVASTSPAEGATVTLGSASFKIFYNGGDGNNVVLVDASTPTVVYAEDTTWSALTAGTVIADADFGTAGNQPAIFGVNAFSTIGAGISAVTSSGQIIVNAGTYGEAVSLNGTKTLTITSSAAVTTNSIAGIAGTTITINGTSLTTGDATNTTFSGIIGGAGALVKNGAGTFTLDGANTFSGGSTLNAGTLQIGSGGTSGTPGTGSITLSGGTLSLNRSDSPTFSNNVSLTSGGNRFINVFSGTTATLSGTVSGGGELWKDGAGTLVLSNASNTHTNSNVINNGVLEIANFGALGSGNLFIGAGGSGTIRYTGGSTSTTKIGAFALQGTGANSTIEITNAATTLSLTAALGNTASGKGYTKSGAGTLAVTVDVTHDGPVTISAGSLVVGNGATAGSLTASGTAAVTNNGTLTVNRSDTFTIGNAMSGTGALTQAGTGTLVLAGANSYGGTTTVSAGTLKVGNAATAGTLGTGPVTNNGAIIFDRSDAQTVSNVISGSGSVTKINTNALTLSGANTFTGATTVSAGTVLLGNATALGTTAGATTVASGAVLDLNGQTVGAEAITLNGTGISAGGALINSSGTAASLSGNVTLGSNSSIGGAGNFTLSGVISGAFSLTKVGAGTATLSGGSNTYSGGTSINAGAITTGGLGLGGGLVTVGAAGTLNAGGVGGLASLYYDLVQPNVANPSMNTLDGWMGYLSPNAVSFATNAPTMNMATALPNNPAGRNYGAGGTEDFAVLYTGILNVTTAGTYTFNTTSDDGSMLFIDGVAVVSNNFLQPATTRTGSTTLTAGAHTIAIGFNERGGGQHIQAQISGPGNVVMEDIDSSMANGLSVTSDLVVHSIAGSGNVNLQGGSMVVGATNATSTFTGPVASSGVGATVAGVTKFGTGNLTLGGANTYAGRTFIGSGTLIAGSATALGSTAGSTFVFAGGVLDLNGQTIGAEPLTINSTGISLGGALVNNSATAASLGGTVALGSDSSIGGSGNFTLLGVVSGGFALTKVGANAVTLSGTNTYTGGTTVAVGTLIGNNNSAFGTGTVTLNSALTGANNTSVLLANSVDVSNPITVANLGTGVSTIGTSGAGVGGNATTFSGLITLNKATTFSGTASDRLAIDGQVTGSVGTLTVSGGSRTTLLSTANNFVGNILITGAGTTLQASVGSAGEVIPDATNVDVGAGTTFMLAGTAGATETINSLTGSGAITRNVAGTQTLAIGSSNGGGTFSGTITNGSGVIALTKLGTGTQTISGTASSTNTASGLLQVSGGTLIMGAAFAGDGAWQGDVTINNTATLQLAQGDIFNNGSDWTINAGGTFNMNSLTDSIGNIAGGGAITNNSGAGLILDDISGTKTFTGTINGTSSLTLRGNVAATGTQEFKPLTATTSTLSNLVVQRGTLLLGGAGTITASGNLSVGQVGATGGNLTIQDTVTVGVGAEFLIGDASTIPGFVTQTGGTVNVANRVRLGHWASPTTSTYTMSGGSLNVTNALNVGWDGSATFTQTGGTVSANAVVIDGSGATATAVETYTLQGGTLNVGTGGITSLDGAAGYALNLGGGTAPVLRATGNFTSGLNATLSGSGANAITVDTNGFTIGLSGVLGGTGALTKIGANVLTLSGANTFSGATAVNVGTLTAGSGSALGTTAGTTTVASGATLNINGQNLGAEIVNIAGTGVGGLGALVNNGADQAQALRFINLTADATVGGTNRFDIRTNGGGEQLDLAGFTLTKVGTAQFSIVGTTVTNGNLTANAGTLAIETSSTVGGTGTITVNAATLGLYANTGTFTRPIVLNSGATISEPGSGATATVSSPITLNANVAINSAANTTIVLNGVITDGAGTFGYTKGGAGTLTLAGANTYDGTTTVSAGTLQIGNSGTSGSVGTGAVVNNSNLHFKRTDATSFGNTVTGTGTTRQLDGSGQVTITGSVTQANVYAGSGSTAIIAAANPLVLSGTSVLNVSGIFGGTTNEAGMGLFGKAVIQTGATLNTANLWLGEQTGRTGEVQQDGGAVTVSQQMRVAHWPSNTSTYTINGGTLTLTGTPAGGTEQNGILYVGIDGTGIFNQTGGTVTAAGMVLDNRGDTAGTDTYTMTGGTLVLGSFGLSGNASTQVNLQGGTVRASASFTASLPVTFTGGSTTLDTNGFDITLSNTLSGSGNFNKINGGTLNISGTSAAYAGTGSMAAGTTNLTGTLGTSATFAVNGGTLIGTGTVGTLNVNTGGTVNPGTVGTVGTLNTGTLNFNGGTYGADLIGTAADKITASTAVNLNGGTAGIFTLNNAAAGVPANTVFTFIDNTSAGAISNQPLTNAAEGGVVTVDAQTARYTYLGGAGGNDFTLTVDGSLTVVGTAAADNFEVRRIVVGLADNIQVLRGGVVIDSRPTASFGGGAALTINAGGNNDNLFVNYGASGGIYNFDINYNGEGDAGAPGDSVTIGGASVTTVTHNFINNNDGNIVVLDGAGTRTVNYTGLEPIIDNLNAVNRVFVFSGVTETISLTSAGAGISIIDSNVGGESVTFANPTTTLSIDGGAGDDTMNITSMGSGYTGSITVDGSGNTDSITITAGLPVFSSATFTAETINAATLTTSGNQTYNGPVLLSAATTLTSNTGSITITGTTNGAQALSLSAVAGNINLASAVGGVTPLTSLTTSSATITALPAITAGALSITATAGGVSGANAINVSGATSVTAAGAITLNGAANDFQGTVSLSATAAGAITVTDSTGGLNIASATTTDGAISLTATSGDLTATSVTAGGAGRNIALTTVTSGNVLVDNVTATGDTVTINSVGAIQESGADAGADITANSLSLTAATGIGSAGIIETAVSIITGSTVTGGIDLANSGALSITSLAASTSGNITLTNTGGIALAGNVSAASGNVSLTSTANITRSAGTVSGTTVTFTATAGSIGASGAEVNTSATSLIVASGGNQFIIEANGANVTSTATAGNITLTTTTGDWTINSTGVDASGTVTMTASAGDILRSGVAADITGTTLTLAAGGADGDLGASGNALLTSGTSIVFTGTGTGDVFITEANGANVTGSTGSGNITLVTTTGDWTVNSTGVDTTGNVTMNASAGDILRSGAAADITGNTVSLNAGPADGDLGASGNELLTTATQISFLGAGTGDVFITESNGANISGSTGSGSISLTTTTGDWNVNLTGLNTSGNVAVTALAGDIQRTGIFANIAANTVTLTAGGADGDIGVGGTTPIITTATTVIFAGSGTGDVLITESNGASFSGTTGSGNITLLSTTGTLAVGGNITTTGDVLIQATAGAITRTAGTVSGDDLVLTAGLGIGASGAAVETSVATIVTTSTADQFINEANGVAANLLNAGAANITLTLTAGALTDNNAAAINFTSTNLTLVAPAGITGIETTVTTLTASTTNADISITETNDVALNLVNAGTGDVFLTGGGLFADNNGAASNVNADALTISAATGIDIDTTIVTLDNGEVTSAGNLRIDDLAGGLVVTAASTAGGTLTITATGGNLIVNSADSTDSLTLQTITSGDIRVDLVTAVTTATLISVGRVDEFSTPDADADITADTLLITAAAGIGTNSGGALETVASFLNATTNTGGIFIDNLGVLEVTGLSATTSGDIVLNNYGEDDGVTVTVDGDITISGPVSTSGNVTITAHEIDDNLDVPPPYTNNVTVTSTITGNVVTLRAGDDLTIGSTGVVTSTGLMTLHGGFGDLDSYGNVVLNGTINPGGGLNLISYGDIVFGPPAVVGQPVINAPGVPVTLTSTTGNIYDNNDNDKPAAAINGPAFGGFVIDVVASVLTLNAPAGYIGEDADTIESTVSSVIANAGNGGVFLWNTAALTVAAVTTSGATTTAVDITSQGSMTINGPVTDDGEEDINFFATGVAADVTLVGSVSGSGNMNFDAGNRVIINGGSSITNGSIVSGVVTVALNAGWPNQPDAFISNPNADLTISGPLDTANANVRLTAPRHVILNGGNADITTNGSFQVNADRDSSAVGTGGTFQQIGLDSTVQAGSVEIIAADVILGGTIDAGVGDIDVFASRPDSAIYIHNIGAALNLSITDLLALRTVGGTVTIGEATATATVFLGGLGTVGVGLIDANYTLNGGDIDFNGGIVLHDDRTLTLNATLGGVISATGGSVTDVVISGPNGTLVIDARGDVTLNTRVTNLGASDVDAALVLNNTNTDLTITGDVTTETADITVGTGTLTVDAGFTLSSDLGAVGTMIITADGISLDGELDGGGVLTLRGNTVATTFGFGNGSTGMFNMDIVEVGNITDGFDKIVIGRSGQTGDMEFLANVGAEVTFLDPVQVIGGTSDVTIRDGKLVGEDDASFEITSKTLLFTGTTPGITTEDQPIIITSSTTLASDTLIDTNAGAIGAGGVVTMIGTINGAFALNINSADAAVNLLGSPTPVSSGTSIGGNQPLDSITVTGGIVTLRPNITTQGDQDYTGSAIRITDGTRVSIGGNLTFNGPVTVEKPANNVAGGDITFNGDVNSGVAGNGALGLKAVNVTFSNSVGDVSPLAYVSVTASGILTVGAGGETFESDSLTIKAEEVDFLADVSIPNGNLSIEVLNSITSIRVGGAEGDLVSGGPTLNFSDADIAALQDGIASIVFGRAAGDRALVVAEGGPVTFLDAVTFRQIGPNPGKVQILGEIIGATSNGSITTIGKTIITGTVKTTDGGKIDISNGLIGADAVLDSSAGDGDIFLRGSWAATVAGSELLVNSGAGDITITGSIGLANGKTPVLGLVTLEGSGITTFGATLTASSLLVTGGGVTKLGGAILTVGVDGQIYDDAVEVAKAATLTSKHADGIVQFNSTVDSVAPKFNSISVTNRVALAGTSAVEFNGAVGAAQRLGTFRIYTKGDSVVAGALFAKSVSITAAEFTVDAVDTSVVDSAVNSQTYLGTGNFLGAITSERLTINSTADITNNAPWRVSGLSTINTGKLADITLTNGTPKNQFGELIVRGRNITVEAEGSINFRSLVADAAATIETDGNITQTSGIVAQSFSAQTAGNITLDFIRNRIASFTDVIAGGTLALVSANSTTVLLDGVLSSGSGDILLAATAGSFTYTGAASITSGSGDWTIYSTLLKYPSYDLEVYFVADATEVGTYPTAPAASGKVVVYRYIGG